MATKKSTVHAAKIIFGKRKTGVHKKKVNKRTPKTKPYRGQGR